MAHKFDPGHADRLERPDRRRLLDPDSIWDLLRLSQGERVADVGCGTGYFTFPAARRVGPEGTIYAVDIASEFLVIVQEKAREGGYTNVSPLQSDETAIPLPGDSVGRILLALVLHEVHDHGGFALEVHRILKPGGLLHVIEWIKAPTEAGPPVGDRLDAERVTAIMLAAGFEPAGEFFPGPQHYGLTFSKALV